MKKDMWHYARTKLAEQVLGMFETGLSNSLIFFAPRRMGKTEFLIKDIQPLAEKNGWKVFYFSFLDVGNKAKEEFTAALADFAGKVGISIKVSKFLGKIKKVSGEAAGIKAGIELQEVKQTTAGMKEVFSNLAKNGKILLLLDEIQVLSAHEGNENFVAGLRTALDMYKDVVKVIFTGSSREGLRRMFSKSSAPFFHFGQNLPFPELGREFTDHLVRVFKKITKRSLDEEKFWVIFERMAKVPQLARSLIERMVLHPEISVDEAKSDLLRGVLDDRAFVAVWGNCSLLERVLLREVAQGASSFFGEEKRNGYAKKLGVSDLPVSAIQSSMRVLQRKNLIGHLPEERGRYFIDDPSFKNWVLLEHGD